MKKRLLTKEEVDEFNRGEVPFMTSLKGTLEWEEGYDYYLVYSTGSFIEKVKKEDSAVYKKRDSTTIEDIRAIQKEIEEKERQIRELEEKRFNTIVNKLK